MKGDWGDGETYALEYKLGEYLGDGVVACWILAAHGVGSEDGVLQCYWSAAERCSNIVGDVVLANDEYTALL